LNKIFSHFSKKILNTKKTEITNPVDNPENSLIQSKKCLLQQQFEENKRKSR